MDTRNKKFSAFLAGFGSAFALFPTVHASSFEAKPSVGDRMYNNFARVGLRLDAATRKVKHEHAAGSRKRRTDAA